MSKTTDVDLRIRAKNLSKAALKDVVSDVDKLAKSQQEQAKTAGLATRSMSDLVAEQRAAAALARELSSRQGLLKRYSDERREIDETAAKLQELIATRRKLAAESAGSAFTQDLKPLDQSIVQTERRLASLSARTDKTKGRLDALGAGTSNIGEVMEEVSRNFQKAGAIYDQATRNVTEYAAAVKHAEEVQAEAARRVRQDADARAQAASANVSSLKTTGSRNAELAALREDIQERSEQARRLNITAEAQRRLRAEEDAEASTLVRNNQALREAVQNLERRRQRQSDLEEVFGRQLTMQEREKQAEGEANARRQRLIELIQSEKGQRLLALEAQRQEASQDERGAKAKTSLAGATSRAAEKEQLFSDTGRKSLSVYQRMRGQVLALASAYVGIYQGINTLKEAVEATNRNQSLQIGLRTANQGDTAKAASDYRFLREETEKLGLVFDDVAPKYANMAVAAREVGLSQQDTRQLFTDVSTSVAAGNLSLEDSEGVFRAMVQIMGKARVQAEELRGQLGDRLPAAVSMFAKANNIALTDLDKMMKSGELGVGELVKFAHTYAAQYGPVMDEVTTRMQASMNRAKNSYNDWLRVILSGDNQTKVKQAFDRISEFFKGREGEEFAKALGTAFSKLVDVLIFLADHIDTVKTALEILVAVQVAKFGVDAAAGLKTMAESLASLATAAKASSIATAEAGTGLTVLSASAAGIAAVLAAIPAALIAQSNAMKNTIADTDDYIKTLDRLGTIQGKPKAVTADDAGKNIKAAQDEIDALDKKADRLQEKLATLAGDKGVGAGIGEAFKTVFGTDDSRELGIGPLSSSEDIGKQINLYRQRSSFLINARRNESKIQSQLTEKETKEREDAEKRAAEAKAKASGGDDGKRQREEARAEAARQRAQAAAERAQRAKEAADDAAAKKVLEIQEEIEKTKVEGSAKSDAQIEANFKAAMARVDLEIQKKRLDIDGLKRQSAAAKTDNSDKFTQMDGQLTVLEDRLKSQAEEERVTDTIASKQKAINDLISERDAKIGVQNTLQQTGQQGFLTTQMQVNGLQDSYNAKIQSNISDFQAFLATLDPQGELWKRLGIDKIILGLEQLNAETKTLTFGQKMFKAWGDEASNAAGNMLEAFSQAYVQTGKLSEGFKAAKDTFIDFIASFLMEIAKAIIKAIILQAITNALTPGASGGYGGAVKSALTASAHSGGVIRANDAVGANPRRRVSPFVFAGAQRFHSGGLPGLQQNEVATILKKGEEVIPESDPRHVSNTPAGGTQGHVTITNVNSWDKEHAAGLLLQAKAAGPAILNVIQKNASAVRQSLGV